MQQQDPPKSHAIPQGAEARDFATLCLFALAYILLHIFANGQYGFHRDELLTLNNARHLEWGYPVYPPVTAFLGRVEWELFGASLRGFRFFAAVAQGFVVLLTGLAARELGGNREAQLVAALAAGIGGHTFFSGSFMSYSSIDNLWWVLIAYLIIRLLKSDDSRWWLAVGAAIGAGMLTKYTIGFLVLGVVAGVLLTPARRHLASPWLWCGAVVSVLMILPNVFWQIHHQFASLDYVKTIHARDVLRGSTDYFLVNQLWKCANPVTLPLWAAGLWYLFGTPQGKRFRLVGWMYVTPLVGFFLAKGRDYYMAPAYPMLLAAGAVWAEQWISRISPMAAVPVRRTTWRVLAVGGAITAGVALPIAPLNSQWWRIADHMNGGNFSSQVGWPDVVEKVAKIRDALPAEDRATLGILAGDEGEAGAVNLYGPAYGLPAAISGMNSNWFRGYGNPPPQTLIVLGEHREYLDQIFGSCTLAGRGTNRYGITNSALDGWDEIFVCRHLRQPWPEFWKHFRYYG